MSQDAETMGRTGARRVREAPPFQKTVKQKAVKGPRRNTSSHSSRQSDNARAPMVRLSCLAFDRLCVQDVIFYLCGRFLEITISL